LAHNITKKLDVKSLSLVHLTLILLLHYLVKCRSRSLAVYNNENSCLVEYAVSEKHCEATKSLKICYLFNISQEKVYHTNYQDLKHRRTETTHQR